MKEYWELFVVFMRIGGFTFGGGYAMLPMLQKEVVDTKHWATEEELMDYYAIGQCTPGIIAVNTATFIGYKTKGLMGAILATLGVIAPAMAIITIIAAFLQNYADNPYVNHAFAGIRVCVCVLILEATMKLGKTSITDKITMLVFFVVLALSLFTNLSTVLLVILTGISGIFLGNLKQREGTKGNRK